MSNDAVSRGMSKAFKARSKPCPKCGRKTVQPKNNGVWWKQGSGGFVCRWCGKDQVRTANGNE